MPDWATIVLVIGAVGGLLTGAAGLWTSSKAARKVEVEALVVTVGALQAENARLRLRLDDVEVENIELRECVEKVEKQNRGLRSRISKLETENESLRVLLEERT